MWCLIASIPDLCPLSYFKSNFAAGFYTCIYVVHFDISSQREREREREMVTLLELYYCYLFVIVCMLSNV